MNRTDIKVAAAAGLSVYMPLYWLLTLPDSEGMPAPALTPGEVFILLLSIGSYLLVAASLRHLSRLPRGGAAPSWVWISVVGAGLLVAADCFAGIIIKTWTFGLAAKAWLVLSTWTMPAAAGVYYSGAAVRLIKGWHRGPDYDAVSLRQ